MIPDIVCIWVSLFLAQRPSSATFLLARRCHSTWRNAPELFLHVGGLTSRVNSTSEHLRWVEHAPLAIGDSIQITLCEVDEVDIPIQKLPQVIEGEQATL
jgi:hypothetical protein